MVKIIDEYLDNHNKYEKKYGKGRTLVLEQVGSFFEMYSTDKEGPNLDEIASLLNIVCTRKDKSIYEISKKNPYMSGFPTQALQKFINILVNNMYTVIVIEQITPPPKVTREVTGIYSPGTYIEGNMTPDTNNVICVYVEQEKTLNGKYLTCIGLSCADVSTGKCSTHNICSTQMDQTFALDETYRFILSANPKEILFHYKNNGCETPYEDIINYLELDPGKLFYKGAPNKNVYNINYQNEMFHKIYNDLDTELSPIEYFNLEFKPYSVVSFILLMNFIYEHSEKNIIHLKHPDTIMTDKHLILGNDAIRQLNILETNYLDVPNKKIKCLFDVVNNTKTAMGRRYLKQRLIQPLCDPDEIQQNYDDIKCVLKNNLFEHIQIFLKEISDIERLERKMSLKIIQPNDFLSMYNSFCSVKEIIVFLKKNKLKSMLNLMPEHTFELLNRFIKRVEFLFDLNELKIQNMSDFKQSVFVDGLDMEIDDIEKQISDGVNFMSNLQKSLTTFLGDKVDLIKNINDGYFLKISKKRSDKLIEHVKNNSKISVEKEKINLGEFKLVHLKDYVKIIIPDIKHRSQKIDHYRNELHKMVTEKYKIEIEQLYLEYSDDLFKHVNAFATYCDFIVSNAYTATLFNYSCPIIDKHEPDDDSYISSKNLRHPIIERLIQHEYVPHDVEIGQKDGLKGMLVYGLNSAGKSSYMKAIGINLIMAQAGMFVASESFNYVPYKMCYTRITGNDNIFKGLSSFTLEMMELDSIINRSNNNTLVIGDEICRGTEHVSGNAIVAASIIQLANEKVSFIFATHLHELGQIKQVQDLENVKMYHLAVDYDNTTDTIIYNRKLQEGSGEPIYGVTVAKHIIKNKEFTLLANEIKNDLLKRPQDELIPVNSKSRYNSKLIIHECQLCGKQNTKGYVNELETHHIHHQKDCDGKFVNKKNKSHIKKNDMSNLAVLCQECHDKVHNDEIEIDGYVMTNKGRKIINKNKLSE